MRLSTIALVDLDLLRKWSGCSSLRACARRSMKSKRSS